MKNRFFILLQYCTPQHLLSRLLGRLAACKIKPIKNTLIRLFARIFNVDWQEALYESPHDYESFNSFFCRELKPGSRPIAGHENILTSPADGQLNQFGKISNGKIFQAKNHVYTALELLGSEEDAAPFTNGMFATIYLSPKDYHRVHMPCNGVLKSMRYVPGKLFSVNPTTTASVPNLFARNERLVCFYETTHGPMALVLVGAMIVASIETTWAGQVTPTKRKLYDAHYAEKRAFHKGEEMGRFKLGSTVILLFPEGKVQWDEELSTNAPLKMGQTMASLHFSEEP